MSLPRLYARVARLEVQSVRVTPQSILLVPLYQGETYDTALLAAGYIPEEMSDRLVAYRMPKAFRVGLSRSPVARKP